MTDLSKQRASCWSITINNPPEVIECNVPGWRITGQLERGAESGTLHFQGMLQTPQVRFSAVKREFPTAHIEVARSPKALKEYVKKDDTRVGEARYTSVLNMFQLQELICSKFSRAYFYDTWCEGRWKYNLMTDDKKNKTFMDYIDYLTRQCITQDGIKSAEFISINPMWRSSWLKFGWEIYQRWELEAVRSGRLLIVDMN